MRPWRLLLLPVSAVLAADHSGAVALAARQLPEHAAGATPVASLAVVERAVTLLALHGRGPFGRISIIIGRPADRGNRPNGRRDEARHERGSEFLAAGGFCGSALSTSSSNRQAGFALLDPCNCLRAMVRK